ncbi:Magnesium transporter NIPA2 [Leucoagaricus sp. SymC.cos]|nr:Magnesium transporter NIPA2 [Leucoagaricus sp. SymC.cos]
MSSSAAPSATVSAAAAASSSAAAKTLQAPANLKVVGIILAIVSGLLIGSSFVFKKKGLLRSQAGGELGEGVAYLKSVLWWTGMIMMILGELCNFAAYAFVEAIVVTPLGALSVVICAILSSFFLNEKLTFFGWLGCGLCIVRTPHFCFLCPKEESVGEIREFQKLFLAPGFLAFAGSLFAISLVIIFYFAPRYGKKNMLWYISICSMIGGISFKYWFIYFLAAFIVVTLITEVYYLNVALALFNTVTPTYYVIFTFCSMVTTVVLFQGLQASVTQIITLVLAFLVICVGITILQMSKIDPTQLKKLDRRSTILLQAARSQTENADEKHLSGLEDPGMDALRGSFGTIGSIIRAKSVRRMSQRSSRGEYGQRPSGAAAPYTSGLPYTAYDESLAGLKRHQLYDAPVPRDDTSSIRAGSIHSLSREQLVNKRPTIKFDSQDVVHSYNRPGTGNSQAIHEHRAAIGSPAPTAYPPLPPPKSPSRQSFSQSPQQGLQPTPSTPREGKLLEIESPQSYTPITNIAVLGDESLPTLTSSSPSRHTINAPVDHERSFGNAVHSAPPTMYARFRSPPPPTSGKHKDSRDIFGRRSDEASRRGDGGVFDETGRMSGGTGTGTLLSFPSVTDSGRSEEVWDEEELEKQKEKAREKDRGRSVFTSSSHPQPSSKSKSNSRPGQGSTTAHRRYPKGDGDDDREESVSLWRGGSTTFSDEDLPGAGSSLESDGVPARSLEEPPLTLREGGIRLVNSSQSTPKRGGVS